MVGVLGNAGQNCRLPLVHPIQAEEEQARVVGGRATLLDWVAAVAVQIWQVDERLDRWLGESVPQAPKFECGATFS